tara:strand:+ start:753 stop:1676 length:924 start_codon:yes stop_codon:yes gene_type:complete
MAVSLSGFAQYGAKKTESDRLAKEYRAQQARSKKRGFFSNILSGVGGKLLGGAITGFLGLTGIGAPIGMALGNMLAKKGAHEMTRSMGADPTKLASQSEYGYGEKEAATLREGLEAQMVKDPMRVKGGFGKELLSSYMAAGLSGDLTAGVKKLTKGDLSGLKKWKPGGLAGAGEGFGKAWEELIPGWAQAGKDEKVFSPLHPEVPEDITQDITKTAGYEGLPFEAEVPQIPEADFPSQPYVFGSETEENIGPLSPSWTGEQGGIVPKYYGGGKVQGGVPTITDYFGSQGVSLGGSHTQSVAQMLGRK